MSTHPNVILMCEMTPDDLANKTLRNIREASKANEDGNFHLGSLDYHSMIMEDDYHEDWQIKAKCGNIVIHDMVTYGYGDVITWARLEEQKNILEAWAKEMCEKFHCTYEIKLTANYW